MLNIASKALAAAYFVLPIATIAWLLLRRRPGRAAPALVGIFAMLIAAAILAKIVVVANVAVLGGDAAWRDLVAPAYFALAALCGLRWIDAGWRWLVLRVFRISPRTRPNLLRQLGAHLLHRSVMFVLTLCFIIAMLVVYRPRVSGAPQFAEPPSQVQAADFTASDGIQLSAWWIPAARRADMGYTVDGLAPAEWGSRTVILCPGWGSGKARLAALARRFADAGFNVLAIDFRAQGESAGRIASFGEQERRDVLAALAWVKGSHPKESSRVFGVGVNTGAAALVSAAIEPDGAGLDALALVEPYDSFGDLASRLAGRAFPKPIAWLVSHVSLPIASLHVGVDLSHYSAAKQVEQVWPRPILVVHGRGSSFVDTASEMEFYRNALLPKEQYWPADEADSARRSHPRTVFEALLGILRDVADVRNSVIDEPGAQRAILRFLKSAQREPVL